MSSSIRVDDSPAIWPHHTIAEGVRLGLALAAVTWVWVALIDLASGHPFHTFTVLGGVAAFTVVHVLLNLVYGTALVGATHGAAHEPSIVYGMTFCLITLEGAIAMLANLLDAASLGPSAWITLFGGSLVGTATAAFLLSRRHPLLLYLHRAEDEV